MNMTEKIEELKKEKNALILAHYYQKGEIQDIADEVGDSYYLSKVARESEHEMIIFCGVKFMAESAKILSPEKSIHLPALDAGCPMADMINEEELMAFKEEHPNAIVVSYINSTTEVKQLADICVTSSNAVRILKKLPQEEILFIPDQNLGSYIQELIPDKKIIPWKGFCITHQKVTPEPIKKIIELVPDAKVLVHPECNFSVRELADFIGSTGEIINYATKSDDKNFVIVTEDGVVHHLKKLNPNKNFYVPGKTMTCINMKKTNLEDVYNCLLHSNNEIIIDEEVRVKAYDSLAKMHEYAQ